MIRTFFSQFYNESDGGAETEVVVRLIKIRKWLIVFAILFYLINNKKFPIKDLNISFATIDPIPREELLWYMGLIITYLLSHYCVNMYLYLTVNFRDRINELKNSWLKNYISTDTETLSGLWRDKLKDINTYINGIEGQEIIGEEKIALIENHVHKEVSNFLPPVKRFTSTVLLSEIAIDCLRFGIIIPILVYCIFF